MKKRVLEDVEGCDQVEGSEVKCGGVKAVGSPLKGRD